MNAYTEEIRQQATKLLESGEVSLVIGYGQGSTSARTTPVFIRSAQDVDQLVWSPACSNNLGVYLREACKQDRVAVVAKGCDVRSINTLIQEKQIDRKAVYIIGISCAGTLEAWKLINAGVNESSLTTLDYDGQSLMAQCGDTRVTLDPETVYKSACLHCDVRIPVDYDVLIGDREPSTLGLSANGGLQVTHEDRLRFWADAFEKCLRCYACRQLCPSCYCTECFADRMSLKWVAKRIDTPENWMYHTTRAMHLAARCVGCGECERVCPVGIPIQAMMREVNRDVEDLFQYKAGMDATAEPALGTFRDNDEGPEG